VSMTTWVKLDGVEFEVTHMGIVSDQCGNVSKCDVLAMVCHHPYPGYSHRWTVEVRRESVLAQVWRARVGSNLLGGTWAEEMPSIQAACNVACASAGFPPVWPDGETQAGGAP
jgi:hypothetical protein